MGRARWLVVCVVSLGLAPVPAGHAVGGPLCDGKVATIVGTEGADRIAGTPGADVIVGLGGRDRVDGAGGDDRVCGGGDADVLRGGAGDDRLFGQANRTRSDRGGTRSYGDALDGGAGHDLLDLGPATSSAVSLHGERVEFLTGPGAVVVDLAAGTATGQGADVIRYVRSMSVRTGEGDDTILGTQWGERVMAGPGNDTVTLLGGPDAFREGRTVLPDDDVVDTGDGADDVRAVSGADRISTGAAHDDVVLAGRGPFALLTGTATDWVFARATDRPGTSYDLGPGSQDYLSLELGVLSGSSTPLPVEVDVPAGLYVVTAPTGPVEAAVHGVERYAFPEGWAVDFLGGDGADSLETSGSAPLRAAMGGGDDRVWGTPGDDVIDGGGGTDSAYAGDGDDTCVRVEEPSSC